MSWAPLNSKNHDSGIKHLKQFNKLSKQVVHRETVKNNKYTFPNISPAWPWNVWDTIWEIWLRSSFFSPKIFSYCSLVKFFKLRDKVLCPASHKAKLALFLDMLNLENGLSGRKIFEIKSWRGTIAGETGLTTNY